MHQRSIKYSIHRPNLLATGYATTLAIGLAALTASAATREEPVTDPRTLYGLVRITPSRSSIGEATFATQSRAKADILRGCKDRELCKVIGRITLGRSPVLRSVDFAERIRPFHEPIDVVRYAYSSKSYWGLGHLVDDDLTALYTPRLAGLIRIARAEGERQQEESSDNPWFDAQEGEPVELRITTILVENDFATVRATFRNNTGSKTPLETREVELRRTYDGWRVDEVKSLNSDNSKILSFSELLAMPSR